ncbi:50S ribosomal protein L14 [Candidatus Woesearchaeota archaeon]|nr:50S ribosomal protein L14 [Candidatus Woesearchaeota archaeon]|tara:strand:+ start:14637 stop:15038 length:402 start_codon:yes stop_codon:yes gene_type:complete
MQAVPARFFRTLNQGSLIETCDNSGAKLLKITSIKGSKTVKGRKPAAVISDLVTASVKKGTPEMRKQVVFAVIVRQKKEFRRLSGEHIKFEDNAAVVVKDEAGNPKGTLIKGPVAKEVCLRWPPIAKISSVIV